MAVYVAPGVYVREIDLSLYIPALSTTIVGMVGRSSKGPVNTRTFVTNQQQFSQIFGQPDSTIGFESYAALQYLRRGRQLWFVRVVGDAAAKATALSNFVNPTPVAPVSSVTAGISPAPVVGTLTYSGTLTPLEEGIVPGSFLATGVYGPLDTDYTFIDDGAGLLTLTVGSPAGFAGTIDYETGAVSITFTTNAGDGPSDMLVSWSNNEADELAFTLEAVSEGEWGNLLSYTIEDGRDANTFKLTLFEGGNPVERFDNLVLDSASANYIEDRLNGVSEYVTVDVNDGVVVAADLPTNVLTPAAFSGGDSDGAAVDSSHIVGSAWDVVLQAPTGLQLFASPNSVDVNLLAAPGWSDAAIVNGMLQICEARADCLAIIDPPENLNPQEVVDWHNGQGAWVGTHAAFNSSYGALYWPWVKVYDAVNGQYVFTPPSGHVLAVYAYNDQVGESWYAPAGLNRGRVISGVDTEYDPTLGEMELMYGDGNAVNMIERFPKDGLVVWGQRTLQRLPTALDRVNVRRLLLYLRKVISTAVRGLVFEPNDEITWRRFGNLTVPFLQEVTERRGLYDFRVKCDETTNTPAVIDRNELHAQIFLKPVKAAEFIQVDLVVTTTGANFDEVLY